MKKIQHCDDDPERVKRALMPDFTEFMLAWYASRQPGNTTAFAAMETKMAKVKAAMDKAQVRKAAGGNRRA